MIAGSLASGASGRSTTRALVDLVRSPTGMFALRALLLGGLLLAWELAAEAFGLQFWISKPSAVYEQLHEWVADGSLWAHLYMTFAAMIIGYVIGAASGIGLGFALGFHPRTLKVVEPYLYGLYALPKIALAPLIVIFFGIRFTKPFQELYEELWDVLKDEIVKGTEN